MKVTVRVQSAPGARTVVLLQEFAPEVDKPKPLEIAIFVRDRF